MDKQSTVVDYSQYRGQWLALDPASERILAHNRSLIDAEKEAIDQGVDPVMEYVPESDGFFVGAV